MSRNQPLRIFVLILALLLLATSLQAQVTLSVKERPLREVISLVEKESGYSFFFSSTLPGLDRKISLNVSGKSISQTVEEMLKGFDITYSIREEDRQIILSHKQKAPDERPTPPQPRKCTLQGKLVDPSGESVVGATIMVEGHPELGGTTSGADGTFVFLAPPGSDIRITCIGFESLRIHLEKDTIREIVMQEDVAMLKNAVVVGYGIQEKESIVGAISTVSNAQLVNSGATNLSNALAGKVSGVLTFQQSGQPGANNSTIIIHGLSSWNGSSPLVMVDGIERSLADIDPNEVENVSFLKDASATAVFGAKGANGVILVTTRRGSEGKPKMEVTVNQGIDIPLDIPDYISSFRTGQYANIAKRNVGNYGSLFNQTQMAEYRSPSSNVNSIRYPDNDFFSMMLKDFASSTNANFNISGGFRAVRYFVSLGYTHEGSTIRQFHSSKNTRFAYDRLNYRSNIDVNLTPTTTFSMRMGGATGIQQYPNNVSVSSLFTYMYEASPLMFPAYFPSWFVEMFPDPNSPGDTHERLSSFASGEFPQVKENPMRFIMQGDFIQYTNSSLYTDLLLDQKLDFITEGLSLKAKVSLSSAFTRTSLNAKTSYPIYRFDWQKYEDGSMDQLWTSSATTGDIYVNPPYSVGQNSNSPRGQSFNFYWEAGINYSNVFQRRHAVTAMALVHQRANTSDASFPHKEEALVSRVTYDFRKKYLFEFNLGITGSEQFAPAYRFGVFPAVAVGYVLSKERFWKEHMPWWSKMKFRYSDGLVGSDSATDNWLYYATFSRSGNDIVEDKAANTEARWETARKRNLGIETGWFDDRITIVTDLWDEHRSDMLITPITTPFVGLSYKPVNRGAMKKHGFDVEITYKNTTASHFYYELKGMIGANENRITRYEDAAYAPAYQRYVGTPYHSQRNGMNQVGNGYFNSIDEIHGYPAYTSNWNSVFPGVYKLVDYTADGLINSSDLHVIEGDNYAKVMYSFGGGIDWKGFTCNILFSGTAGKNIEFNRTFVKEFGKGNYVIHKEQLDFWTPDNRNAAHPALTFDDESMLGWAGGNIDNGFLMMLPGHTWRRSDYVTLKEVYLAYRFDGKFIKRILGLDGLSITLTGNNLFTLTNLVEGNPQVLSLSSSFYPIMASIKSGIRMHF